MDLGEIVNEREWKNKKDRIHFSNLIEEAKPKKIVILNSTY